MKKTTNKCSTIYNARVPSVLYSLNNLFGGVLVAVAWFAQALLSNAIKRPRRQLGMFHFYLFTVHCRHTGTTNLSKNDQKRLHRFELKFQFSRFRFI